MKKLNKKLISVILIIVVFFMLPINVVALNIKGPSLDEAKAQYSEGSLLTNLSKTAVRTGVDEWKIELKFTPTKPIVTSPSYEVVLALDTTNSLGNVGFKQLKSATIEVVKKLYEISNTNNIDISLGLIGFGGIAANTNEVISLTNLNEQNDVWLTNTLNNISSIGMSSGTGTNYEEALIKSNNMFNDVTKRQILIFLADGKANRSNQLGGEWNDIIAGNHAKEKAKTIKDSGKLIYSIHYNDNDIGAKELLMECSSGTGYYYEATNYDGLLKVFNKIINKLVIVKFEDFMGPNFQLIDNHDRITIDPLYGDAIIDKNSIIWVPNKGVDVKLVEHTLTYYVKAEPDLPAGNYNNSPTNGVTRFIYSTTTTNQVQQFFTSPYGSFTKASAQIIYTGLPDSISNKPSIVGDSLIYTGYDADGDDIFKFTAPEYNEGGITYSPKSITYHAVGLDGGIVVNNLPINGPDASGNYSISASDLGSGHYTFNVHYDDNNHIVDFETFEGSPIPINQNVLHGNMAVKPTDIVKKDGHRFEGWYTSADNGLTLADTEYNFSTPVTSDMTLYAKWTSIDYTASFDIMGGDPTTKPADQTSLKYGNLVKLPDPPIKENHTFMGWYTSDDGINLSTSSYNFNTPITDNIILYAKWEPIPIINHLVNFITFGGTPIPDNQIVENNNLAIEPKTMPLKEGHIFEGWYSSDDNGINLSLNKYDFSTPITSDITLYAKWTPIEFTVIYNDGVKGEHVFDDEVFHGIALNTKTPNFSGTTIRDGYTFDGWYTSNDNGVTLSSNKYDLNASITSDITLYAKWIPDILYNIEIQIEGNGTVLPDGGINKLVEVKENGNVSFSMTPSNGWYIHDIQVDGISVGSKMNYDFTNVVSNHIIKVIFKENSNPIIPATPVPPKPEVKPEVVIPYTGDNSSVIIWMFIAITSGLISILLLNNKLKSII